LSFFIGKKINRRETKGKKTVFFLLNLPAALATSIYSQYIATTEYMMTWCSSSSSRLRLAEQNSPDTGKNSIKLKSKQVLSFIINLCLSPFDMHQKKFLLSAVSSSFIDSLLPRNSLDESTRIDGESHC
jgi:hypothetical protein